MLGLLQEVFKSPQAKMEQGVEETKLELSTSVQSTSTSKDAPRVGGVSQGVPWTGGSNLSGKKNDAPADVLCFRPQTFKELQRQHESLKQGLEPEQRLEFVDGNKTSIGLTVWITWMMMLLVTKGMDTMFMILDETETSELNLLTNWGKATKEKVQEWVKRLKKKNCKFDLENLKLSTFVV